MSGLFGSAGMGLAGYKMAKRTRGISEFVFESQEHFGSNLLLTYEEKEEKDSKSGKWSSRFDKKNKRDKEKQKKAEMKKEEEDAEGRINHLSVMICVSGWLIDKEDYKKSFGIVPHEMQDEERLRRFYQLYCPQKVERASEDIKAWKNTGGTSGAVDKERAGYRKGADERSSLDSFKHSVSTNLGSITSAVGMVGVCAQRHAACSYHTQHTAHSTQHTASASQHMLRNTCFATHASQHSILWCLSPNPSYLPSLHLLTLLYTRAPQEVATTWMSSTRT